MPVTSQNQRSRRPVGKQAATPARTGKASGRSLLSTAPAGEGLALPHERDESSGTVAEAPDPVIVQAKRDLDAGQVDTDMRVTPGLDARERGRLVPGPGGKRPASGA